MSTLSSSEAEYKDPVTSRSDSGLREEQQHPTLWNGLLVGLAAGMVASGAMLWAGKAWGGSILPQIIAERTTAELPLSAVRDAISRLEENAKPAALIGITLGQVIIAGIAGAIYARFADARPRSRLVGGSTLGVLAWLFLSLIAAPVGQIGVFAKDSALGFQATQATFILASALFGGIIALAVPLPAIPQEQDRGRRTFLQAAAALTLAIPAAWAAAYVGRQADKLRTSFDPEAGVIKTGGTGTFDFAGMPQFYTPEDAFYIVSKNLIDPTVDSTQWDLEISGLVERPQTLSYSDILARPSVQFPSTLECISNPVGGTFMSNTIWTGFPLKDLLEEAGLQSGIVDIKMEAADGYSESIPLSKAMHPDTMLVHSIGGQPLSDKHGFPLRLIVPGIFGMKNVKWIRKIEAVNVDYQGYWQHRNWSDEAGVVTMSRIDVPKRSYQAQLGETVQLGGAAFAGNRGISKVEVTVDGGNSWHTAQLSDVPSNLTWRLWRYDHIADTPGLRAVSVRAVDGNGQPQDDAIREPLPDGATGYDREWFEVLDASGKSVGAGDESASKAGGRWLYNGQVTLKNSSGTDRN